MLNTKTLEKNQVYEYNFSNNLFKSKVIKNVKDYSVNTQSIIVNLGIHDIPIFPKLKNENINCRKLPKWKSANFSNVIIKEASMVLIIEDKCFRQPDFKNSNISKFPLMDNDYFESTQLSRDDVKSEIKEGSWEHVSKIYPALDSMYLWKTPENKINIIDGVRFDPYYALNLSEKYNVSKEIDFKLKNYIWFAPKGTHCGIHNIHPFIEFHTQLSGVGRMIKYTSQNSMDYYEEERLSIGNSQSHVYCDLNDVVESDNKMKLSYPWHEYYADTDCVWLVSEFWPVGNF